MYLQEGSPFLKGSGVHWGKNGVETCMIPAFVVVIVIPAQIKQQNWKQRYLQQNERNGRNQGLFWIKLCHLIPVPRDTKRF